MSFIKRMKNNLNIIIKYFPGDIYKHYLKKNKLTIDLALGLT